MVVLAASAAVASVWAVSPDSAERAGAWAQALFTSPEQDFSVAFPRSPSVDGRVPESDDASGYRIFQARDDGGLFQVRVDQYPRGIRVPMPDAYTYGLILRAYAVESSSRLVSTSPAQLGGHPALEGLFVGGAGARELRRVLMLGRRIYQVSYTRSDGGGDRETGTAFLESFKLVSPPAG